MTNNTHRISYIIPAFNCEETVEASVASIFNKNFIQGDEVVIVDDASLDNTPKVLQSLKKKYEGIQIITHKFNKGGGASRNTAVENSKYDYIFCLDADNILAGDSIHNLKKTMIVTGGDGAAFQRLDYFKTNITDLSHTWSFDLDSYTSKNYLSTVYVPGASGNYLYTKDSWIKAGGYPDFAGALDTWGFGLRQAFTGSSISIHKNSGYYHRLSEKSYWKSAAERANPSIQATRVLLEFYGSLSKKSLDYILSKEHRETWLDELDKNPLALNSKKNGLVDKLLDRIRGVR